MRILPLAFLLCGLSFQDSAVARWAPIKKGDTFQMTWSFEIRQTGSAGGTSRFLLDSRTVKAELVAETDINGKGNLKIMVQSAAWKYAKPEYSLALTFDGKNVTERVTPKVAGGHALGIQMAAILKLNLKRDYVFPVENSPRHVGGAWTRGRVVNGLFDWMIVHDKLTNDGPKVGDSWEESLHEKEQGILQTPRGIEGKKLKMRAKKSRDGIKVSGMVSWNVNSAGYQPEAGVIKWVGPISFKHSVKREWSFAREGYFSGGKREVTSINKVVSKGPMYQENYAFSMRDKLTIKKVGIGPSDSPPAGADAAAE